MQRAAGLKAVSWGRESPALRVQDPSPKARPGFAVTMDLEEACSAVVESSSTLNSCATSGERLPVCWSVAKSGPAFCHPVGCSAPGSLSLTTSRSLPKFMCVDLVIPC